MMMTRTRSGSAALVLLLAMAGHAAAQTPSLDGQALTNENVSAVSSWSSASPKATAGANRLGILVLAGQIFNDPTGITATWNGAAMTAYATQQVSGQAIFCRAWYIIAPPTGASTIAFNAGVELAYGAVIAASFQDVHQTVPLGTAYTSQSTGQAGTTFSATPTSASGELAFAVLGNYPDDPAVTAGTQIAENSVLGTTYGNFAYRDGATPTITWTVGLTGDLTAMCGGSLKPVGAAAAAAPATLSLLGIGK